MNTSKCCVSTAIKDCKISLVSNLYTLKNKSVSALCLVAGLPLRCYIFESRAKMRKE